MVIDLTSVNPDCRAFVQTVELLLERRRGEVRRGEQRLAIGQADLWGPRSWKRTELEDIVYSSYKQMRQGRITRPPRRETVMEIADYLNCTLEERNLLLIAAESAPVPLFLGDEQLGEILPVAAMIADQLQIPAMVINRDWHIHYLNPAMFTLFGVTPEELSSLPAQQHNALQLLFDHDLPLYGHISDNRTTWLRMARQTIYGFKMANLLCQFEPWYQTLLQQLLLLPEFATHWETVEVDRSFEFDQSVRSLAPTVTLEAAMPMRDGSIFHAWLRPLIISVGYFQFDFPAVVAFTPANAASQDAFVELGIQHAPLR